jgi:hypothetical protein
MLLSGTGRTLHIYWQSEGRIPCVRCGAARPSKMRDTTAVGPSISDNNGMDPLGVTRREACVQPSPTRSTPRLSFMPRRRVRVFGPFFELPVPEPSADSLGCDLPIAIGCSRCRTEASFADTNARYLATSLATQALLPPLAGKAAPRRTALLRRVGSIVRRRCGCHPVR